MFAAVPYTFVFLASEEKELAEEGEESTGARL